MDGWSTSRVQDELVAARQATTPEAALLAALAAADALLSRTPEAPAGSLAERARVMQGSLLDKREAIQLARLAGVGQRVADGLAVDPLDAEQAIHLVQALADRLGPSIDAPPVVPAVPGPTLEPVAAPPIWVEPVERADVAASDVAVEPVLRPARHTPAALHWLWFAVWAGLTVIILALGPLALALLGPPWMRYLALLPALGTAVMAGRSLRVLAQADRLRAALGALVVGVGLGLGWGLAAERGWLPPLHYVLDVPTPSARRVTRLSEPQLRLGATARVEGTQGNGLRVRSEPGLAATELARIPDGTRVRISDGPRSADGLEWWQVQTGAMMGWASSAYLTALD